MKKRFSHKSGFYADDLDRVEIGPKGHPLGWFSRLATTAEGPRVKPKTAAMIFETWQQLGRGVAAMTQTITNQLFNPNFGGTYTGGIAEQWGPHSSGNATVVWSEGATYASSGSTQDVEKTDAGTGQAGVTELVFSGVPTTNEMYGVAYIYVSSFTPGARLACQLTGRNLFEAATIQQNFFDITAVGWYTVYARVTRTQNDLVGYQLRFFIDQAPAKMHIDRAGLFAGGYSTYPFSGDDPGAVWDGAPYAATSTLAGALLEYPPNVVSNRSGYLSAFLARPWSVAGGSDNRTIFWRNPGYVDWNQANKTFSASIRGGTAVETAAFEFDDFEVVHVGIGWDASTWALFINGVESATGAVGGTQDTQVVIGGRGIDTNTIDGYMWDVGGSRHRLGGSAARSIAAGIVPKSGMFDLFV